MLARSRGQAARANFCFFGGGDASLGHIVIVCPDPSRGVFLYLSNGLEQVMPQPVVAYRAVLAFDVGILLGITGLDML